MSSMSGYITYIEYQYGSNKGGVKQGDLISNPFRFGKMDDNRVNYTSSRVVESINAEGGLTFAWDVAVEGTVEVEVKNAETEKMEWVAVPADKLVLDDKKRVTGIAAGYMAEGTRVRYIYDNVVIPQNDLPMVKAEMKSIALVAKARRIAVKAYAA